MAFKVGDTVKIVTSKHNRYDHHLHELTKQHIGKISQIESIEDVPYEHPYRLKGIDSIWADWELELVKGTETTHMGRATYLLKRALPELKKGAVVQETCDSGDQDFEILAGYEDFIKYENEDGNKYVSFPRGAVENEPTWWEQVFPATPAWMNQQELDAYKAFQAKTKTTARTTRAKRS